MSLNRNFEKKYIAPDDKLEQRPILEEAPEQTREEINKLRESQNQTLIKLQNKFKDIAIDIGQGADNRLAYKAALNLSFNSSELRSLLAQYEYSKSEKDAREINLMVNTMERDIKTLIALVPESALSGNENFNSIFTTLDAFKMAIPQEIEEEKMEQRAQEEEAKRMEFSAKLESKLIDLSEFEMDDEERKELGLSNANEDIENSNQLAITVSAEDLANDFMSKFPKRTKRNLNRFFKYVIDGVKLAKELSFENTTDENGILFESEDGREAEVPADKLQRNLSKSEIAKIVKSYMPEKEKEEKSTVEEKSEDRKQEKSKADDFMLGGKGSMDSIRKASSDKENPFTDEELAINDVYSASDIDLEDKI